MADVEQISKELQELKKKLNAIYAKSSQQVHEDSLAALINYLVEERERTNKELQTVTEHVRKLEEILEEEPEEESEQTAIQGKPEEVPLSEVDAKVIEFIQTKGMASAAELQEFMHYKGKNAASARLNLLYKRGLLDRFQLGHKVYYRYAGKANQILITPPQ
ncbi:MAG: hypothetical protein ACP5T4_02780 [Candidatus Micrarchaeia archaeon]